MRYRTLGRTGAVVSEVGFGGAGAGLQSYIRRWDPTREDHVEEVVGAIRRAVELGVTYFDTAPRYGSEEMFGRALKPHRSKIFLATKVRAATEDTVRQSVEESLARLQTDYVDLIQYHGDCYTRAELERFFVPDGILAGLQAVRREGMARFIGFTAEAAEIAEKNR